MSITPNGLAKTLAAACRKRATVTDVEDITFSTAEASFRLHDDDGGILRVTVTQFKEPNR